MPEGASVLVALSGGGDSTALLHLLAGLAEERGLTLAAAHFDHGLRPGSREEAARVAARAREAGVRCRVGRPRRELSPDQASLREARYAFLERAAEEEGVDRVATGHQADDQAETVLFRFLRGTGMGGLAGIPARRGRLVRPLLPFGREEVRAWLELRAVPYLEDPSNRDPRWARSRIRSEVLPAAANAWDAPLSRRLVEVARAAGRADAALDARAGAALEAAAGPPPGWGWEEGFTLDRSALLDVVSEIRGRAVRLLAERLGAPMSRGGTRQAIQFISEGRSGGRVDLGGGLVLAREFERLVVGRPAADRPDTTLTIDAGGSGSGRLFVGGRRLGVAWGPAQADVAGPADRVVLSEGRLAFPLRLRSWEDGDRLRTSSGTRKLKELFREARVPESRRSRSLVAAGAGGRIAWVEGIGRDPELAPGAGDRAFSLRSEDV